MITREKLADWLMWELEYFTLPYRAFTSKEEIEAEMQRRGKHSKYYKECQSLLEEEGFYGGENTVAGVALNDFEDDVKNCGGSFQARFPDMVDIFLSLDTVVEKRAFSHWLADILILAIP